METKSKSISCTTRHSYGVVFAAAVVLQLGASAGYAQTGDYLYTGSKTTITLNPGTYTITAYGAQGGSDWEGGPGGLGAEMEGEFYFSGQTTLTLLVGGAGGNGSTYQGGQGGGGGGGSFVANGSTALLVAGGGSGSGASGSAAGSTGTSGQYGGTGGGGGGGGFISNGYGNGPDGTSFLNGGYGGSNGGFGGGGGGGQPEKGGGGGGYSGGGAGGFSLYNFAFGYGGAAGGSIVDSSAISDLTEISGVASPDGLPDGEIIILAVPEPSTIALGLLSGLGGLWTVRRRRAA